MQVTDLDHHGGAMVPDRESYRLQRAARDLYSRSARGPVFYVAASVVLVLTIDSPAPVAARSGAVIALATLGAVALSQPHSGRRRANPDLSALAPAPMAGDRQRLPAVERTSAGGGMIDHGYSLPLIVALLCAIAYGSSICSMFAMDLRHAVIALACLSLPGVIAFSVYFPGGVPIALGLGVHGFYALLMLDRTHRDYVSQLDTEYALMQAKAETERLVAIDSLTGLANRREYERRFAQAWNMAARSRSKLALLVLDLDNFKQLNDRHGHAAGDACLRHFADLLAQHFRRAIDLTARIGGEEFAVILPGLTARDAAVLGEEFRANLAGSVCHYRDQPIGITVSIGAGAADWDLDPDPLATFARIDQACYEAKKQGAAGWSRSEPIRPAASLGSDLAEEVALAEVNAGGTQDGVSGGGVEIEVGQHEMQQILHAFEGHLSAADLEYDVLVLAAIDLGRGNALDEIDGFGQTLFQLLESRFTVVKDRIVDAGQTGDATLGLIGGDLHLAGQGEHVRS